VCTLPARTEVVAAELGGSVPFDLAHRRSSAPHRTRSYPVYCRRRCRASHLGRVQIASKQPEKGARRRILRPSAEGRNASNQAPSGRFRPDALRWPDFHRTQEVSGSNPLSSNFVALIEPARRALARTGGGHLYTAASVWTRAGGAVSPRPSCLVRGGAGVAVWFLGKEVVENRTFV
jgi:hypothetical protein